MLKKVNISCNRPFKYRYATFSGKINGAILDTKIIQFALENKAKVEEVLKGGKTIPLGFHNFDTYNGEPDVDSNSIDITDERSYKRPPVETIGKVNNYRQASYDNGVVLNSTRRGMGLEVVIDNKVKKDEDTAKLNREIKEAINKVETIDKNPKSTTESVAPKLAVSTIEGTVEVKDEMIIPSNETDKNSTNNKGYKKGYKK